ncbi:MAG TPA: hypothetical protein VLW17_04750, partial [Thermoanaerobaculaceae bacterium]|nr:hypothetical protein [Thermoanaerobaculaceae bacterium]
MTLGYLVAPNLVFLLGWLRPAWGVPAAAIALACLADAWRGARTDAPGPSRRELLFVGASALACTLVAGIGELGPQVE